MTEKKTISRKSNGKWFKKNKKILIAIVVLIIALILLSNKNGKNKKETETQTQTEIIEVKDKKTLVEVEHLEAQDIVAEIKVFGQTASNKKIPVKSRTDGTVKSTIAHKGQLVKTDDVLIELSMDDRMAKLNAAKAQIEESKLIYKTTKTLVKQNFDSEAALIQAEAGLKAAKSNLEAVQKDINYTKITAPFDGIFDKRTVEIGDYVGKNTQIGTLISLNPIKIKADIPERYIGRVQKGRIATTKLLSGQKFDSKLTYVSSSAESATRTFNIELESENPNNKIAEGLTVEITLPLDTQKAHKISTLSALTLNEVGTIGIKTVEDGIVQFYEVTIIREDKDGFWIAGLPENATVITTGQEYVKTGEAVRTQEKEVK